MSIFRLIFLIILLPFSTIHAQEFELDRGIGFSRNHDIEDWISAKGARNNSFGQNSNFNRDNSLGRTNLASSYGNSIVIQTQPGSHVVLNASQINHGNQTAEVNLNNLDGPRYENVEIPTYDQDRNLSYSK